VHVHLFGVHFEFKYINKLSVPVQVKCNRRKCMSTDKLVESMEWKKRLADTLTDSASSDESEDGNYYTLLYCNGHWRVYCGEDGSDWNSSRYQTHCSSGLQFSCLAWKLGDGSRLPHMAWGHGGGGWLHCSCGWSAVGLGRLPGGFLWGL